MTTDQNQGNVITLHAAFIDRVKELPRYLNLSESAFWDRMSFTQAQAEDVQRDGLFMYDAYHVLATFPKVNPVWLFMGFGKPLLQGYEADVGAVALLDYLETKEVLLGLNDRRIKELERSLMIAQAKRDSLFEAITALTKDRHIMSAQEFEALLEKLEEMQ